jgi:predicted anti-sigma-YlaC factor YlaD
MAGDCRGTRLACSLQLDGELTLRWRERLARHLRWCGSCRSFARELEAISKLLRTSPGSTRSARTRAADPCLAPQCRQLL